MEILEGLKGPLFMVCCNDSTARKCIIVIDVALKLASLSLFLSAQISSTDGQSTSGQTPDIAWECFQKKGYPRVKSLSGKRFSCKIDGVEVSP